MNPAIMPVIHFRQITNGTITQVVFLDPKATLLPTEWPALLQRYEQIPEQEAA